MSPCSSHQPRRLCRRAASFLAAFMLAGLLITGGAARGDVQEEKQRHTTGKQHEREQPPTAVPQSAKVNPGERVEIILTAHGQAGKTIDFLLRDRPAHGTLTDFHQLTRTTASVTYVHSLGEGSGSDSFTYAVQATGTPVSAPGNVEIEIVEPAPRVVAGPGELDFGAVNVGEASRAELVVENRGGGVATGRVEPPTPWTIDGSPDYRIGKGERATFRLVFQPKAGRPFSDFVRLGPEAGQSAHLFGTGIGGPAANPLAEAATSSAGAAARAASSGNAPTGPDAISDSVARARQPLPEADAARRRAASGSAPTQPDNIEPQPGTGAVAEQSTNPVFASLNDATIGRLLLRDRSRTTLTVAWKPPVPAPKSYRVELRYLYYDENKDFHADWRPYAKVEVKTEHDVVTATLKGLPAGAAQTLRVVAVDDRGNLSMPSPLLYTGTLPASTLFTVTPLRVLFLGLAVCLWMLWRRRRLERSLAAETERRRARNDLVHYR